MGSGKTAVAFLALLAAAGSGMQGAIMAPTEILASQHCERLQVLPRKSFQFGILWMWPNAFAAVLLLASHAMSCCCGL